MTLRDVTEKYFKDDHTINFHPSDRQGDCYLRYHFNGGVEIWMGSEDGEILIFFTSDPIKLEKLIILIVYH